LFVSLCEKLFKLVIAKRIHGINFNLNFIF
jgi:hypothetical protein